MRNIFKIAANVFAFIFITIIISSCAKYDNFTAYFNTYYNMERLTKEAESEFEFQDEKKRIQPRIFIPQPEFYIPSEESIGPPPFMSEMIVNKSKRQPVETKLDSIVIKGSKILARRPKSNFVEGSLYLMAKSFFYREDWMNSQIKCSELIDRFPAGDMSPDAHLLFSKNLLVQRKFYAGEMMLSRTVDISWQKKRYDILSEAFRIQAELALFQNDLEKALRPYRQAIAQSDDGELKAKWQVDMAALLYRIGDFERAEKEFAKVTKFSPDYLQTFEAYLYRAGSLIRLGRFYEGDKILDDLAKDGKFEEWYPFVYAQMLQSFRYKVIDTNAIVKNKLGETITQKQKVDSLFVMEKYADSAFVNNPFVIAYYFERGMDYYKGNDWGRAKNYFAKSRMVKTPVIKTSDRLYSLLNIWDNKRRETDKFLSKPESIPELADSAKVNLAMNLFELGRIHEELGFKDSVEFYYKYATTVVPIKSKESARCLYAYARVIKEKEPEKADSLLDVIVNTHPLTEYGKDARLTLGYTDAFVIDTAAEFYSSGINLMRVGDYYYSINQFNKVVDSFPQHKLAPKSLYTIGWIYEKNLVKFDTALYYYQILISKYPDSEYAKDVKYSHDYKLVLNSGAEIPDSLKMKEFPVFIPNAVKGIDELDRLKMQEVEKRNRENNVKELLKDPSKYINEPGKLMKDPIEMLKNIDIPNPFSDPAKFFNLEEEKSDSTKQTIQELKKYEEEEEIIQEKPKK